MDKKAAMRMNILKGVLSIVMLIVVALAVSNGSTQSNEEMQQTAVRGYIEAVSDENSSAWDKYMLKDINSQISLLNKDDNISDIKYIKFVSIAKEKKFKPQRVYFKDGSSKLYLKGCVVKVRYRIRYKGTKNKYEVRENIFTMVKTINGNYKIINISPEI